MTNTLQWQHIANIEINTIQHIGRPKTTDVRLTEPGMAQYIHRRLEKKKRKKKGKKRKKRGGNFRSS